MRKFKFLMAVIVVAFLSCNKEEKTPQPNETQGYNLLLIGNSFFKPYAEKFDMMAIDAGFVGHNSNTVFRGGQNGRPINFWNDSNSEEHSLIKSTLDQGNIEYFGKKPHLLNKVV